ncbi:hypothetical protein SAMN04515665_11776 [Blastococcus sp. DSM 46786]|nr:hypothetical protein [Blastococcus sp. DSM 46786]SEL70432.1 hypothetical protein SAMN04515665_11776 [Blastococcus sp. DSM 46786]
MTDRLAGGTGLRSSAAADEEQFVVRPPDRPSSPQGSSVDP